MGDGPVSPSSEASSASLTAIGNTPWVSWSQPSPSGGGSRQIRVARLDGGVWRQAGPGYAAPPASTGVNDRNQIASVNGFPWVAFTQDDGTTGGGPGTPGCCSQVRVARLEPEFGELTAFPASDAAALLAGTETYGLPYPIGFEYDPDGAEGPSSTVARLTAEGNFALAEARPLTPATLYTFQPFSTAGTPAPLARGGTGRYVTPPSSPSGTVTPAPAAPAAAKAPLVVAIMRAPRRVHRGRAVRLRVLTTEAGTAALTIRRGDRARVRRTALDAGGQTLVWRTRRVHAGRYRLRIRVQTADGRLATDAVTVRVLRKARTGAVAGR